MSESKPNDTKRTLAAIVFTDIVDFSAQMQTREEATLRLAQRDLDAIREICKQCEGRVLKSTGDGLLMFFESATQAVACAMRAQAHFTSLAKKLPPEEQLQHRIGIHLGDVFVSEDDVMGDGVNVAARLQAEAPPGGICVSQTVYDVVKNRLGVKVTYLGPRELKNIREAVPVYQILLDAAGFGEKPILAYKPSSGWKWLIAGAIGAVVMAGGVVATWLVMRNQQITALQKQEIVATTSPAESATPAGIAATTLPTTTLPTTTLPADQPSPRRRLRSPDTKDEQARADQRQQIEQARQSYLPSGDFQGFVGWLEANQLGDSPLAQQYRSAARLKKLAMIRLQSATWDEPILIDVPTPDGSREAKLWMDENGGIVIRMHKGRERTVRHLPPRMMLGLYQAVATSPEQRKAADFLFNEYRNLSRE